DSWGTNNGTVNGATWTSSGVIRGALSFDGVDDYVSIPATSGSLNINANPVTLEAWIKPNSVGGSYKEIVGRGTAASNGYGINLNGNKISLGYHGGSNFSSAAVLTTGNWYHIVGVIKGANSKIYINGVADINTGTINVVNSTLNGSIGASSVGTTYFFNGLIDEVSIYNAALTAQEIQQRYAESASRHGIAVK
ncbi:MAG: LamG domain-containing protein, partial [Patescibacteria group bacterium]